MVRGGARVVPGDLRWFGVVRGWSGITPVVRGGSPSPLVAYWHAMKTNTTASDPADPATTVTTATTATATASATATDQISTAVEHITGELQDLSPRAVQAVLALDAEGATIPFMARYRKERTGSLDEVQLAAILDCRDRWAALEKRRTAILESLAGRDLLTPELEQGIHRARDLQTLEDLYLPWRPRRRTRADRAREEGLEPLARQLLEHPSASVTDLAGAAARELGLEEARCLAGAGDIVAAECAEDPSLRSRVRDLFQRQSAIHSTKGKTAAEHQEYRDYHDRREPAPRCPSHRLLAILRGENEGALRVEIRPPEVAALRLVEDHLGRSLKSSRRDRREWLDTVALDAYRRLLAPSLETENRRALRQRAEEEAARVFAANLEDLLMAPPLGGKPVLAIDPGFRTGSKVVALDETGRVLDHRTIYPVEPRNDRAGAERTLRDMVAAHGPRAIAVGSGTAGREVEAFVRSLELPGTGSRPIPVVRVNEAGASIYSASAAARTELPHLDVTVRGAVSIGRRLQDPLSELVKIDPAAVGVGQYQHDLDPALLERSLSRTVESCVNAVGVELNTAGPALLARVAGLGPALAAAIVRRRDKSGPFPSRDSITAVSGIGAGTARQAMGFLRCAAGENPLERTGVHPERYPLVERIARDLGCTVADLCGNSDLVDAVDPARYVVDARDEDSGSAPAGLPTILDILEELRRPGRDPRRTFEEVSFRDDVHTIDDLSPRMELPGVITNVTNFGAFVDIGVHRDGLIHISHLSDRFVRDPREIVRAGQTVNVTVLSVDRDRQRIELSNLQKEPTGGAGPGSSA